MPAFPEGLSFADILERRAKDRPEATYVRLVARDGSRQALTYGDLDLQTMQVAQGLAASGAVPGDRVLVVTPNCLEQIITILAAARSGLISVPVNPGSAPAELAYLLKLVEPRCIIAGAAQIEALEQAGLPPGGVYLCVTVADETGGHSWAKHVWSWSQLKQADGVAGIQKPATNDVFQLLLTSGTTGAPKAVVHSHSVRLRSAYRHVLHARVREDDILLNAFPAFHINCLDSAILPALVTGATAVIFESFSATTFWKTVCEEHATVVSVIPTVIRALNAQPPRDGERDHCVRLVSGSLRPTEAELQQFMSRFRLSRYESGYGLTEAGNAVTATNAEVGCRPPSIGMPLFDRTVDLFDESGQPVPVGQTGEIVVKCEPLGAVMDGYWRDPQATAAAMTGGWLRTGDLARRESDGSYYFVGRVKDVIKRSGENIGAHEVESVLMEHPGISEVAVIGVLDLYRDEAVMAVIVMKEGARQVTLPDIRRFCEGRLTSFKIPTEITVVGTLPKGLLGKVDKKLLRNQVLGSGSSGAEPVEGGAPCTAP